MNGSESEDWVEVTSCSWIHEAQFIVSVLEGAGLEACIPDAYTLGVDPLLSPALGGVRVFVHGADLQQAIDVLADVDLDTESEPEAHSPS